MASKAKPENIEAKKIIAKVLKAKRQANKALKVDNSGVKPALLIQHTTPPAYFIAGNVRYEFKARQVVFGDSQGRTHTVTLNEHGHHQWMSFTRSYHA